MKIKRLFTAAAFVAMAAVFGCALFFSCGNPGNGETLRWRSTIDIPVNMSFPVPIPEGINFFLELGDTIIDLGTDDVPVGSDVIDFLRKFTDTISYALSVTNNSGVNLTLYALLFGGDDIDDPKTMPLEDFYDLLTESGQYRISLLGKGGLTAQAGRTGSYSMPANTGNTLYELILTSESLMWRWLARVSSGNKDSLNATDSIHARLRLRISGANSFDSLLAM